MALPGLFSYLFFGAAVEAGVGLNLTKSSGIYNMEILKNDVTMRTVLNDTKVIKSKRQIPNLKRLMVISEFKKKNLFFS